MHFFCSSIPTPPIDHSNIVEQVGKYYDTVWHFIYEQKRLNFVPVFTLNNMALSVRGFSHPVLYHSGQCLIFRRAIYLALLFLARNSWNIGAGNAKQTLHTSASLKSVSYCEACQCHCLLQSTNFNTERFSRMT